MAGDRKKAHATSNLRCVSNVVRKAGRRGNFYLTKSRPDQKIDAAVALMMAIGRAMVVDEEQAGLSGFLSDPIAL
jgi:phage terminase large subunit-like protein